MVCRTALDVRCNPTIVYPQSTRLTIDTSSVSSSSRQYVKRPCPRSNVDRSVIKEEITKTSIFVYNQYSYFGRNGGLEAFDLKRIFV